jgi:hypothetical protein
MINPREPLTNKAKQGITTFALYKCNGLTIRDLLIRYTLEAERMKRSDLYQWLEVHHYKWNGVYWVSKKEVKL